MYVYTVEKLKQVLGLGFAASEMGVVEAVESMCKNMLEIKAALGLPPEADSQQIMGAIQAFREAEAPAAAAAAPPAAEKVGWFKGLFKS
jgi:phage terminase small subunit